MRCSAADAFLHPALRRPNLEVTNCAFVERIVFEGDRAVGVELVRNGVRETVRAEREVIVSAGTYQSPVLLMLSGIGPAEELAPFGIAVREDLPVGRNLQDHCMVNVNYLTDEPALFGIFTPENFALLESEGRGPLSSNYPGGGRLLPHAGGPARARRRVPLRAAIFFDEGLRRRPTTAWRFGPVVIKPTARGRVMLRAPMPDSKPRVLCNFLTTEEDRGSMIEGVRIALEIAAQPALRAVEREPLSVPASDSEEDIFALVRRASQTVYHPTSTCAMGAVVDSELRVYGVEGLRVVDASVMPTITRANTHATTIMIAEKAADLILGKAPLAPATAAACAMNRFEQAVYDCMNPTAELLEQTTKPLHRAMLLNFWRHVHLEGAGEYEVIVAPDMMVEEPVYRVTWGASPAVITGKRVCSASTTAWERLCSGTRTTFLRSRTGGSATSSPFINSRVASSSRAIGYDVDDADALYHVSSRQAFVWPYDGQARLIGENLYEDKTSLTIEEVSPDEAITPARVREIHREQLAKLEAERGDRFWVLSEA